MLILTRQLDQARAIGDPLSPTLGSLNLQHAIAGHRPYFLQETHQECLTSALPTLQPAVSHVRSKQVD